jgi:hypothetical protein
MEVKEDGKEPWRITCRYGEAIWNFRYKTWDMMHFLKADFDHSWLCTEDFNELRREEKLGTNERDMVHIELFREVVDVCQLCDLGYKGLDMTFESLVPMRCTIRRCHERRVKFSLTSSSKVMPTWSVMELSLVRGEWRTMVKDDHFVRSHFVACKLE